VFSSIPINENGYYEIPVNLQHNPLNGVLTEFTLGEVIDHVDSIVDNIYLGQHNIQFDGVFPGISNLRDLGNVSAYGTKFVQHSGPLSLSMYHIASDNNVIRAIDNSRDDYSRFKRTFLTVASTLGVTTETKEHVDLILNAMNANTPVTSSYYFSDMIPYGANTKTEFIIRDSEVRIFSLATVFTLDSLSTAAVLLYLNGNQLLHGIDYRFNIQGFVELMPTVVLQYDDELLIYEYSNTDGCLIPETPTKLGIWPKYTPKIFKDTSLVTPRWMIQGHDGSLTLIYGSYDDVTHQLVLDYRDELILELEKRIYNNIKVQYDPTIFDICDTIPGYDRTTPYSLQEFNQVLLPSYYHWAVNVKQDFSTMLTQNRYNTFVYNYSNHYTSNNQKSPGYWRGIYRWMYDTDRPHICPWEMLGFSEEPIWWVEVYGPAPYTSDNIVMWTDLSNGCIKAPNTPIKIVSKFVRPTLLNNLPVNENGELISPQESGIVNGIITEPMQGDFVFGDVSPVEAAWRRSSYYPFSVLKAAVLLTPAKTIGVLLDRSRISRNLNNQLVYTDTNVRINLSDIKIPSIYLSTSRIQTAGIINYLINNIDSTTITSYNQYKSELTSITAQLCYRVSGFTSKEKFKLMLESKTPLSSGSIFIPQEDYTVVLNTSSPVNVVVYSGVIITKIEGGYEIKGYSTSQPYFKYYKSSVSGSYITIGGVSAAYAIWAPNQYYVKDRYVKFGNRYFNTNVSHTSSEFFESSYFTALVELPISGGERIEFKQQWDTEAQTVLYGTKFSSIQGVVDFLLGYGKWLADQGFIFDEYNTTLGAVSNWETSAKEFVFWTVSNWGVNQQVWEEWIPNVTVHYNDIVRYNGDYYKALTTMNDPVFNNQKYAVLSGLNYEGNSVLTLSPAATTLLFKTTLSVVDDIQNPKYVYEMFDVNGNPIPLSFINAFRTDNVVSYKSNTESYIYCASFHLVQREHVIVINNTTMFNDTIFNPESGYKQDKIKVSGYVSTDWNGSVNVPGFVVDRAEIARWVPWTDYAFGDVVKHRTFFYSATSYIPGTELFNDSDWSKLAQPLTAKLLPNWNYKATQFTDFYSLDSDNFDITQQRMAQHLIGYQKRQYLENIIQDDVSEFKFYQGMIVEKGTQNVLNKLFDVLSADDRESLTFYEEWAIRSGSYGACESFNTIEFILNESSFKANPQGFELVYVDPLINDQVIRLLPSDIYSKPIGYSPSIWKEDAYKSQILRPCGHVRSSEVSLTVKSLSELVTLTNIQLSIGNYIWCTFEGSSWNVYTIIPTSVRLKSLFLDSANDLVIFTTTEAHGLTNGMYIQLIDTNEIPHITEDYNNVFFKVNLTAADGSDYIDTEFSITLPSAHSLPDAAVAKININTFESRRYATVDSDNIPADPTAGDLIWTDHYVDTDNKWTTWQYQTSKWEVLHTVNPKPDITKIKQAFLYNKINNQLITYLDIVDSNNGKNPNIADQEVKFKSFYDPAIYSVKTSSTVVSGVNVDDSIAWTTDQIGTLWWDLTTAKFINSYTEDVVYRNTTWSTLAYGASIDVYEWVESTVLPSVWDEEADTEAGLADGISGKSLYSDLFYSQTRTYDTVSQRYSYTYYFWVKNKITIPSIVGRKMSSFDVANLIANPRGEGYEFLALTGLDSFSLVNIKPYLQHDDVVLSIEYWINDKIDQNMHTQWKIISTNENTILPAAIEQKWFDSLCGRDLQNREVPDPLLPVKLKYGIQNRPRQSMFVNRCETVKQFIEQLNLILKKHLIVDTRNISNLFLYDPIPNINRGLYDAVIDTDLELRLTVAKSYIKPLITPLIVNGRVVGINIINAGRGYLIPPYATVVGSGVGAMLKLTIDTIGQIIGCTVVHSGEGYTSESSIEVRNYSVLIKSDLTSNDSWSIYEYNRTTETWNKTLMQSYNTRKYWEYLDWYDEGYNQFTAINYSISTYSDLSTLTNVKIDDVVTIRTTTSNRWVLLKKYDTSSSADWTQSYKIIGSQNGTIQFSSLLYDFIDTSVGYEGMFYDQGVYDNSAVTELRIILELVKNNLLINDLKSEYLQLFFTCVRSALSEQTYIDWIFKTSFVNVMHNVGPLHQSVTYQNDNLTNFEEYVSEVKPYRTQVREYVSLYDTIETTQLMTSDFDVPAENRSMYSLVDGNVIAADNATYPTKSWYDNAGFSVTEIRIINGGAGYTTPPTVTIVSTSGKDATAKAYVANGKVSRITVVTAGSHYVSVPEIKIEYGLPHDGIPAVAVAILGNGVARSSLINLKFDRIYNSYAVSTLNCVDKFSSTGAVQYKLTWAPDIRIGNSSITVNGVLQLRDTYKLKIISVTTASGYKSYAGAVTFEVAPVGDIVVTYIKDVTLLTAVDRIQYYYKPELGDLGKDLAQLMTGIEYAGVTVSGLNTNNSTGWGSTPYYTDSWDSFKPLTDDYRVSVASNTYSIKLPYVPELGSILNVYYSYTNIVSFNTDGRTLSYYYEKYENIPEVSLHKIVAAAAIGVKDSNIIQVESIDQIKIGDIVSNSSHAVVTTKLKLLSTVSAGYYLTVKDTSILYENMPLYFIGTAVVLGTNISVGGLLTDHTYYVHSIDANSSTRFTVKAQINDAAAVQVTTATGNMTIVAGEFKFNTTVTGINADTNTITLSDTLSTVLVNQTLIKFSRTLIKYQDFSNISRTKIVLKKRIVSGMKLELSGKLAVIRLDDDQYGSSSVKNDNAIMLPFVADGVLDTVTIPSSYIDKTGTTNTFTVNAGDIFIIRNSQSSGEETEYDIDTAISGGNFALSSAAGIASAEIVIDGSELINQDTDAGPEEVVPGNLVDAVAIKIFDINDSGSYMQFKDMLNRTHIKRLNANKQTRLAVELLQADTTITVVNASAFEAPSPEYNKPGVIDIHGERIEFFTINDNVLGHVLGQLRRGTLGTGVATVHEVDSIVQEIGASESIPIQDKIIVNQYESNGSQFVDISVLPIKSNNWNMKTTFLAVELLDTDDTITVTDASIFEDMPGTVTIQGETIKFDAINGNVLSGLRRGASSTIIPLVHKVHAIVQNITLASYGQCDNIEVLINGVILKKMPYQIHNININAVSPLGDVQYDAEFSVDGKAKQIRLRDAVPAGTLITVIKRIGFSWTNAVTAETITRFLNGAPGSQYPDN
jgi:hypothetical protein